ncbi:MAG: arylamine N-acetyltransferase [Haloferacaceae archaeon]
MDVSPYLSRLGVERTAVASPDVETLARLQRSHVTTVPFETLAVTGDPFSDREGEGVSLAPEALYEKIVERRRGGFCFELNGLFGRLLAELGYDVRRVAAMVVSDGEARPPANHLTHLVSLDRTYVVDVGLGGPPIRRPLPLDGDVRADGAGNEWRVVESDRPDSDYAVEYREPGDGAWEVRYVFGDTPRELSYFEATCEYLQTAPESPFTGDPVVTLATDDGHLKLTPESFTRVAGGETRERKVTEREWYAVLEREFGLRYRSAGE